MSDYDARFARQLRLPEVGDAGQSRLCEAELSVGTTRASQVQVDYLRRAGVRHISRNQAEPEPFVHAEHFRHEACRDIAAGAWLALDQIRRVLGA